MNVLPKINRRAWLALWAQECRRRRACAALVALLPAPAFYADGETLDLCWDWEDTDPYRWNIWQSTDGGETFFLVEDYWAAGSERTFAPDGSSEIYFIVGVDETGREVTYRSEQICPDDYYEAPLGPLWTDLLGYWPLEEGPNEIRWDYSGNGLDLTEFAVGEGDDATVNAKSGIIGDCADFSLGYNAGLKTENFPDYTGFCPALSFSFWFNHQPSISQILLTVGYEIWIAIQADVLEVGFNTDGDPAVCRVYTPEGSVVPDEWIHCAVVYTGDLLTVYLNGVASGSAPSNGALLTAMEAYPANVLSLGCALFGYYVNGAMDEVGCWQRALTAAEVAQLYNDGNGLGLDLF